MKIAFLSNVPQVGTFRLGSHHLAREMSKLGHSVCHVSTPISRWELATSKEVSSRREIFSGKPLEAGKSNLARNGPYLDDSSVTHFAPVPALPVRILHKSRAVAGCLSRVGFSDADFVLIDQLHLFAALQSYAGHVIYRPTDAVPAGFGRELERKILELSSGVIACSPVVLDGLDSDVLPSSQIIVENGVDLSHFVDADTGSHASRSGVVYVGAIDFRFDWDFVVRCAEAIFPEPLVLAGPVVGASPPVSLPANVQLVGVVDYASVPGFLSRYKVGILPLNSDPSNAGRSPMKFYEYLASRLYVVSTRTETLAVRDPAPGTFLFEQHDDGIADVIRCLSLPASNGDGFEYSKSQSWSSKAKKVELFLDSLL